MKAARLFLALGDIDDELLEDVYIEKKAPRTVWKRLTAAAGIALAAAAVLIFSRQADITAAPPAAQTSPAVLTTAPDIAEEQPVVTEPAAQTSDPASDPDEASESAGQPEVPREPEFDFDFTTFYEEPAATGAPVTYEDIHASIGLRADKMHFVRFEITERFSPEEAADIAAGLENCQFCPKNQTLSGARIEYDYLNGEEKNIEIYLLQAGTGEIQPTNEPLYRVGDRYAAMFYDLSYDSANSPCAGLYFAIIGKNGENFLYQLDFGNGADVRFYGKDGVRLGTEPDTDERARCTSTGNNPELYSRKFSEEELVSFIREDWMERGYAFPALEDGVFRGSVYEYTEDGDVIPIS